MRETEVIDTSVKALTLAEGRDRFIADFILPQFEREGATFNDLMDFRNLTNRLSGRVIRSMLDESVDVTENRSIITRQGKRSEVKVYMIDQKARELFGTAGRILADLANLKDTFILPETEDELSCLVSMVGRALKTGEPITFVTPVCPDWSRDNQGRYDFKSLGGGDSFIANKFFANAPEFLEVFQKNGVSFKGVILFADWGLETEIDAKGTYGQKLSPEDVQMSFDSTFAAVDQTLSVLQKEQNFGRLFADFKVVSMKDFLASRIDEQQVMAQMRHFFTTDKQGRRLLEVLARDSLKINRQRLGVTEDENRELSLRNLVEYSTVGHSVDGNSFLVVCESRTTSRCYNLPRERDKKVPVFYVKGREALKSGVNIL